MMSVKMIVQTLSLRTSILELNLQYPITRVLLPRAHLALGHFGKSEQQRRCRHVENDVDPEDAKIPPTIIIICTYCLQENIGIVATTKDTFSR